MLKYKKLDPNLPDFKRHSEGAAGFDLYNIEDINNNSVPLELGYVKFPTGLAIEIPNGYFGLIKSRSSFYDENIHIAEDIIDSDYRGELHLQVYFRYGAKILLRTIPKYTRLAQLLIIPCFMEEAIEVNGLSETKRGTNGFGSTGK